MNPIPLLIIGTLLAGYIGYRIGERKAFILVAKVHALIAAGQATVTEDGTVALTETGEFLEDQRIVAPWQ